MLDRIVRNILGVFPPRIRRVYESRAEIWLYLVCGGIATAISVASHYATLWLFGLPAWANTSVSWACAATAAFFMNRSQVFASDAKGRSAAMQAVKFFASRLATLGLEIAFMAYTVETLGADERMMKLAAQVFITILNYAAGKLIFRKKERKQ